MRKPILIILFNLLIYANLLADYNWLEDKQKQIYNYKKDIEEYENRIQENTKLIADLGYRIKDINEKIKVLSQLISNANTGNPKGDLIKQEADFIYRKERIERLKEEFKKRIIWLYKHGSDYQTQLLFTSESPGILYARLEYLNSLTQSRKTDFDRIKYEEMTYTEKKLITTLNKDEMKKYFAQKREDKELLIKEKITLEDSLSTAKTDNDSYTRQIEKVKSKITDMEYMINQNPKTFIYRINNIPNYGAREFEQLKGQLILPVNSIDIIKDFGRTISPLTGTINQNFGIDVSIAENSEVISVADGVIENVIDMPLFQNVIIIRHGSDYRTLYGILKKTTVKKGDIVRTGTILGYTGSTAENQSFHFEIWKGNSPLDPKFWVRRGFSI
ncbi:MAG: peptidoglycan DD-metalloendopeptidase family protein [Ignavibacteria bacterium]|nr:peptidoglycan DD-metalloendopeptidase family protein [Ignavibacteria bacterium]